MSGRADAAVRLWRASVLKPVTRWTPTRKFDLCMAIEKRIVTPADAMAAHGLSGDELKAWMRAYAGGLATAQALRVTKRGAA